MDAYVAEILFGGFLVLLLIGAPITVALGGAGMVAYIALDKDPIALVQIAFNSVGSFPLMALPAFVLAGALMEAAGISKRLVDIAESLAGPITGGLGAATVIACLFFGAISGSGPATTAAVGMLMIPAMARRHYDKSYASAVTAASGGLGIIVPPSIPMVILASPHWACNRRLRPWKSSATSPRSPSPSCLSPASCQASSWPAAC